MKEEDFKIVGGHAEYRPTGRVSLEQAIQMVAAAVALARERHVRSLLVNVSRLTGFKPPSLIDRYHFMHEWARAAGGSVRIAMVARPELIDPQKFGVTVGANIGLTSDVFTSEEEALRWLEELSEADRRNG
jgi:hypothetical protein